MRAWRGYDRFEGRAALRSWLYRIATNVCLSMLGGSQRRARPMDLGPAPADRRRPAPRCRRRPGSSRSPMRASSRPQPTPRRWRSRARPSASRSWPHCSTSRRVSARCSSCARCCAGRPTRWPSCSRRRSHRSTARSSVRGPRWPRTRSKPRPTGEADGRADAALLARYVDAFERYDMESLTALLHEDATGTCRRTSSGCRRTRTSSSGASGPGIGCRGSRLVPVEANGSPAWGQYKPGPNGTLEPWSIQVMEVRDGRISGLTFFLDTERLFPLFGLPLKLEGKTATEANDLAQPRHERAARAARPTQHGAAARFPAASPRAASAPAHRRWRSPDRTRRPRRSAATSDEASPNSRADAVAQAREVRARDRALDRERDRGRGPLHHLEIRPAPPVRLIGRGW